MPRHDYGEEDLKAAGEFRDIIHEEALEIVRKTYPGADKVFDRYPVEAYFEDVWEYPRQMVLLCSRAARRRRAGKSDSYDCP